MIPCKHLKGICKVLTVSLSFKKKNVIIAKHMSVTVPLTVPEKTSAVDKMK